MSDYFHAMRAAFRHAAPYDAFAALRFIRYARRAILYALLPHMRRCRAMPLFLRHCSPRAMLPSRRGAQSACAARSAMLCAAAAARYAAARDAPAA